MAMDKRAVLSKVRLFNVPRFLRRHPQILEKDSGIRGKINASLNLPQPQLKKKKKKHVIFKQSEVAVNEVSRP